MAPQIRSRSLGDVSKLLTFWFTDALLVEEKKKKNRMYGVCVLVWRNEGIGANIVMIVHCFTVFLLSLCEILSRVCCFFYNVYAFRESTPFVIFVLYYCIIWIQLKSVYPGNASARMCMLVCSIAK